jgi:hypothetical protein
MQENSKETFLSQKADGKPVGKGGFDGRSTNNSMACRVSGGGLCDFDWNVV